VRNFPDEQVRSLVQFMPTSQSACCLAIPRSSRRSYSESGLASRIPLLTTSGVSASETQKRLAVS
jgi:hypothetical protein